MKLEVSFTSSLRIKVGNWHKAVSLRPWFTIDFAKLGEAFPRSKTVINYLVKRGGRWRAAS